MVKKEQHESAEVFHQESSFSDRDLHCIDSVEVELGRFELVGNVSHPLFSGNSLLMKAIKTDRPSAPLVDLDKAERGTDLEVPTSGSKGPEDQQDDFKVTPGSYKN